MKRQQIGDDLNETHKHFSQLSDHDCSPQVQYFLYTNLVNYSQISLEKMEALYTTHDELSHLLDRHEKSLRTEYGPTAEPWSPLPEIAEILFAFNQSIRTGQWQAHLAVSKQMLPWFFAYDHQNYARCMSLYLGEMSQLPETYPEIYKEFMYVNTTFSPKAILTCL